MSFAIFMINKSIDIYVVLLGFIFVNIISLLIAKKIKKHLSPQFVPFLFLVVVCCAGVYLITTFIHSTVPFRDIYVYLWAAIILTQIAFFIFSLFMQKKRKGESS